MNLQLLPAQPLPDDMPAPDPDGHGLAGREGMPLGLPPDSRGLRPNALAVPHAGRLAGPGDAQGMSWPGPTGLAPPAQTHPRRRSEPGLPAFSTGPLPRRLEGEADRLWPGEAVAIGVEAR